MERLLANAIVWFCFDGWADSYATVLADELRSERGDSQLLIDLWLASKSRSETWSIFTTVVLPVFDALNADLFKRELVFALETLYRDPSVSLGLFASIAYPVWSLLEKYGIDDADLIELCFADDDIDYDNGSITRAYYEDVFRRFRNPV